MVHAVHASVEGSLSVAGVGNLFAYFRVVAYALYGLALHRIALEYLLMFNGSGEKSRSLGF